MIIVGVPAAIAVIVVVLGAIFYAADGVQAICRRQQRHERVQARFKPSPTDRAGKPDDDVRAQ